MNASPSSPDDLSQARRIDQICDGFELQWTQGKPPRVEAFLVGVDETKLRDLVQELVLIDVHYRRQRGETPTTSDYLSRFPFLDAQWLEQRFSGSAAESGQSPAVDLNHPTRFYPPAPARTGIWPRVPYFGDYELLSEIARGGMGVVYRARQVSLQRIVALKLILSGDMASAEEIERFRNEACSAASLVHPNIVPIHEVGTFQGQHYLSMGYVDGPNLDAWIAGDLVDPREAARIVRVVAQAIQFAHDRGVIHRDLKPSNIIMDQQDTPHVTDFGLAKRVDNEAGLTVTGQIVGTPCFMSPEQAAGATNELGPHSDVYSMGAVLYALLTGRPPFKAASAVQTLRQVIDHDPAPPRELNKAVPKDLETIALKCLEKSSRNRYPSAQALVDELGRFLDGRPLLARPISRPERLWRWSKRNPVVASLSAVSLFLTMALVIGLSSHNRALEQKNQDIRQNLERAVVAEAESRSQFWESMYAQARLVRESRRPGQRLESMKLLQKAASLRWDNRLRDDAILALRSPDVERVSQLATNVPGTLAVMFDYRGETLARAGRQGEITLHRSHNGPAVATLKGDLAATDDATLEFSPDDRLLAVHWDGWRQATNIPFTVWDVARREKKWELPYRGADRETIYAFSPQGDTIAIGFWDRQVRVYDANSGAERQVWKSDGMPICLAISPNGDQLAIGTHSPAAVAIYAVESGEKLSSWLDPGAQATTERDLTQIGTVSLGWHPDGQSVLAGMYDGQVYSLRTATGTVEWSFEAHSSFVHHVGYRPGCDTLVTAGGGSVTRLWDLYSRAMLLEINGMPWDRVFLRQGGSIVRLQERPDPELVTWRFLEGQERLPLNAGKTDNVYEQPTFSVDGQWLFTEHFEGLKLWRLPTRQLAAQLPLGPCRVLRFENPDDIVTVNASAIQRWSLTPGANGTATLSKVGGPILEASFLKPNEVTIDGDISRDGRKLVVASSPYTGVLFVDLETMRQVRLGETFRETYRPRIAPNGRWVAAVEMNTRQEVSNVLHVWDTVSNELVLRRDNCRGEFTPDSQRLLVCGRGGFEWFDTATWKAVAEPVPTVSGRQRSVRFSRDGKKLAVVDGRGVRLLQRDGTSIGWFPRENHGIVTHFTLSPSADWLYMATGEGLPELWNLRATRTRLAEWNLANGWPAD